MKLPWELIAQHPPSCSNAVFILQMLKYVGGQEKQSLTSTEADLQLHPVISTRIVVTDTDVQHSGTYKCEPGAAPVASVNVHVLDGKLHSENSLRPLHANSAKYYSVVNLTLSLFSLQANFPLPCKPQVLEHIFIVG